MANVKFLRGTAAQYTAATKNDNTFYYTTDDKNLYLGETKISNAADLTAAIARIATNEGDISSINSALDTLKGGVADDGSILKMINDVTGALADLTTTSKASLVAAINELKVAIGTGGTASVVTVDTTTTTEGMAKTYTIKQGETTVGTIDIPKDMVVSSAEIVNADAEGTQGTFIKMVIANSEDVLYINVGTLVDIYKAEASAAQIQLTIDQTTNTISAEIVDGSVDTDALADNAVTSAKIADDNVITSKILDKNVTKAKLADDVQTSLGKADSAIQAIAEGTTDGTVAVDGKDVAVHGLGSAAYTDTSAYDAAGSANSVKTTLLGNAETDTADSATIAGVKKYADKAASDAQLVWGTIEEVTE